MSSNFHTGRSGVDEVRQFYAEYHADYGDVFKVKTGRSGHLFLQNGNSYISATD